MKERPKQLDSPVVPKIIKGMARVHVWLFRKTKGRIGSTWRVGSAFSARRADLLAHHDGARFRTAEDGAVALPGRRGPGRPGRIAGWPAAGSAVVSQPGRASRRRRPDRRRRARDARSHGAGRRALGAVASSGRPLPRFRRLPVVDRPSDPRGHLRAAPACWYLRIGLELDLVRVLFSADSCLYHTNCPRARPAMSHQVTQLNNRDAPPYAPSDSAARR